MYIVDDKLSAFQYGFTKNGSTIANLIDCYGSTYRLLDSKAPIDIITIDLSKAFDRVNHEMLYKKLGTLGVSNRLCNLLIELISNRKQLVRINNTQSSLKSIWSGVPQGSCLSPLLFKIYLDDLLNYQWNNNLYCYADDLKLMGISGPSIQLDLERIDLWSNQNKMIVNKQM